jgi:Rrf2 family protein
MRLTRASEYAIHAVVAMASQSDNGKPTASHLTAQARGIPERFLLKVLKPLVSAGILLSIKGPNGGYRLARPTNKITLLEIIEAVDGPMRGEVPRIQGKGTDAVEARLQEICQQVGNQTRQQLEKVRISDLVGKAPAGKK